MSSKERPILFSAPMVRAILDGRKTQTRRVVKFYGLTDVHRRLDGSFSFETAGGSTLVKCPYGKPGDSLWVRETHARCPGNMFTPPHYLADGPMPSISERHDAGLLRTFPSIHMPRWASRIDLLITGVRVERLQDISEADAAAEGLKSWPHKGGRAYGYDGGLQDGHGSARGAFWHLWESINGPESWSANPWVWVVEFKRKDNSNEKQGA